MLFNSLAYLIFFPVIVLVYFLIPWHRVRNGMLLVASYYFYMRWDPRFIVLMIGVTLVSYFCGLLVSISQKEEAEHVEKDLRRTGNAKIYTTVTIVAMLLVLGWFKYANFLTGNLVSLMRLIGVELAIPKLNVALPVGISFFTFQAMGYVIDVYRGTTEVEKNFFRFALFVSFFPQLVAGPIERSGHLLQQFKDKHTFDSRRVLKGLMLMVWGFFIKMVLADRIAIIVDQVFNYYTSYQGTILMLGAGLFSFQIYCDFNGYSLIAIGSAQVLGFDLIQNFEQPYLARTVADFWRRWHMSLTNWFRDYIYFPLGGSRVAKWKKYRNIMIVFLISGLWHGADWTYVIWGGMNGLMQVIGDIINPARKKLLAKLHVNENSFGHRLVQTFLTYVYVTIAWVFFRATSVKSAVDIIVGSVKTLNPWVLFDGTIYNLGLNQMDFWAMVISLLVLLAVDILHENKIQIRESIMGQPLPVRWAIVYAALFMILIFGIYGPGYDAASFIYFQF